MSGRVEELALERHAAVELELRGDRLWRAREYVAALAAYAEAEAAAVRAVALEEAG